MKPAVLLHGMHRSQNFGDILLTLVVLDWLRSEGIEKISLVRARPDVAQALSTPRAKFADYVDSNVFLLGGGGFFQRMDGPIGSFKALIKYAAPILLANLARKRTAIIGVGADNMPNRLLDWLLRQCLRGADVCLVRDETSYQYVSQLLGKKSRCKLFQCSDLVFAVNSLTPSEAARKEAAELVGESKDVGRKIAIHLSQCSADSQPYARLIDNLCTMLEDEPDIKVLLLEDHPSSGSGQVRAQKELKRRLQNLDCRTVPYPGAHTLVALLDSVDAVLTDKLHVGLAAAAIGTMPFSVAKHRKNLASFRDIGIAQNCVLLSAENHNAVANIVTRFCNHSDAFVAPVEVRERVALARQKLADLLASAIKI